MDKVVSFLVILIIAFTTLVAFRTFSAVDIPVVTEGKIVGKEFIPAHEESKLLIVGKVPINSKEHVPDTWEITILGKHSATEELRLRTVKVTKEKYENLHEGDYYVIRK